MSVLKLPHEPTAGELLVLTGTGAGRRLSLRERTPETPLPLPLMSDLLEGATARPFGVEERCRVAGTAGGLALECDAGSAAAGVVVDLGGTLPRGASLAAAVRSRGAAGFSTQLVSAGADAESPLALKEGATRLPVPGAGAGPAQLAIVAPAEGGRLQLEGLELVAAVPKGEGAARSAWAWEPRRWRDEPERLIAEAVARGVRRLSVTLDIPEGRVRDPAALGRFVGLAGDAGLTVEAVEGDPQMVEAGGLGRALERARAIAAYQAEAPAKARLAGVQYDIEPYSLAGWGRPPTDFTAWAGAVNRLAAAAATRIDLVLPCWIADTDSGRAFLAEVRPSLRSLTAMTYRTDPAALTRAAEPLLHWGAAAGVPVRIALEAGPVADEWEELFAPAPAGTLAVKAGAGASAELYAAATAVAGAAMYASLGRTRVRGDRISFLGDEARMMATAGRLEPAFAAWPSFAGYAFHGLGWSG